MTNIFKELMKIADPIMTDYKTDLTIHDYKAISRFKTGEVWIWAVRDMGTHLFPIDHEHSRDWIHAVTSAGVKGWYKITVHKPFLGDVERITVYEAYNLCK